MKNHGVKKCCVSLVLADLDNLQCSVQDLLDLEGLSDYQISLANRVLESSHRDFAHIEQAFAVELGYKRKEKKK